MPFTIETAKAWLASGKIECSPRQASGILHSDPMTILASAKYQRSIGQDSIGGIRFRFAGRNCRLTVADILRKLEV